MKKLILFFIFLLIMPTVYSKEYNIPLLAVKETEKGFEGSTANLYLELKEGRGRVFLDTYPLTKLDTQMSTRFAKEIACSKIEFDCNKYDFFYTIKSSSVIVGGPSAGAAISLLTIAALKNLNIKEGIAITGTINSGGLIGPVGGLKEKLDAASSLGIKKVLIPHGEVKVELNERNDNLDNSSNNTIDLIEYGKKLGIEVIEVFTISEALYHLTGIEIDKNNVSLEIDEKYMQTMRIVTEDLCRITQSLKDNLSKANLNKEDKDILDSAENLTKRYEKAFENKKYYSAASYCFGANTKFSYLVLKSENLSKKEILSKIADIKSNINELNKEFDKKEIKTITDLEVYMVVKERLVEAEDSINKVVDIKNKTEELSQLAYSIERLNSAVSWSNFFDKGNKEFIIDKEEIEASCSNKIYEAEERLEYLKLLTSMEFKDTEDEINLAKEDLENKSYELCLFKASLAKADSDVILNTVGINESQLLETLNKKLEIIKRSIVQEQQKGVFPVIGYSYYEYSDDLKEKDIFSSMLFAEYSLELSNLDIYFKSEKQNNRFNIDLINSQVIIISVFISGLLIGFVSGRTKLKKRKK